jgi:hypothetical protein
MLGMFRGPTKSNFDDVSQTHFLDGVQPVPIQTMPYYDDILQACDICPAYDDRKQLLYVLLMENTLGTPHTVFRFRVRPVQV